MWGPDKTKGKLDELKGKAKQAVGALVDNDPNRVGGESEASHSRAEQGVTEERRDLRNGSDASSSGPGK